MILLRSRPVRTAPGVAVVTLVTVLGMILPAGCGTTPPPAGPSSPSASSPVSSVTPTASTPSPTPEPTATPTPTAPATSTTPATPTPRPGGLASPSHGLSPRSTVGPTGSSEDAAAHPVIVIDPGHSGRPIRSRTVNGLLDYDYPNTPEMSEVFDVSSCVAAGLRRDGYRVVLTKTSEDASVSLTERAAIATRAHAALAISVHDDHSQNPSFEATYSQRGVPSGGRYPVMYRGTGSHRTVFDRPSVAKASERYARIIAARRTASQGRQVRVAQNSFTGRPPLEPGNLALVQLLTHVPWVYNEMGARSGSGTTTRLSLAEETGYAAGLLSGVESAVPRPVRFAPTSAATLRRCLQQRR